MFRTRWVGRQPNPNPMPTQRLCHQLRPKSISASPQPSLWELRAHRAKEMAPLSPPLGLVKLKATGQEEMGKESGIYSPALRLDLQNHEEKPPSSGKPVASRCNE